MRKLFGTDGIRGKANVYPITSEIALKAGMAVAMVLTKKKEKPKIVIGKDTRRSGYMLESAITSGLTAMGASAILVGPMPTPAIAHLTKSFAADAGIMLSASHNPAHHNGIKFFDSDGFKLPDEVEEKIEEAILTRLDDEKRVGPDLIGDAKRIDDAQGRYIEYAKGTISNRSLKGLKIVLDVSHGAAYRVAPLIFAELGAELIVINNKPDGYNINKDCGALHPEVVREAVLAYQADAGITLDGDADRIIMVDEKGKILDGDYILSICGLDLLKKGALNKSTVVGTGYTNMGMDVLFKKYGGKVVRAENGDRYVIELMRKEGYNLGGEQSGHIIFLDHITTGDGIISGLQVLSILQERKKTMSFLAGELIKFPQVTLSVSVEKKVSLEKMKNTSELIRKAEKELLGNGRLLVRYSGTENKARIMVEGSDEELITKIAKKILKSIKDEAR